MKVKELFSDPSKWTQNTLYRDNTGKEVPWNNPNIVSFCLLGAIRHCYRYFQYIPIEILVRDKLIIGDITIWNDDPDRTFEEVKELVEELDI